MRLHSCVTRLHSCVTQLAQVAHPEEQQRHAPQQLRHATIQGISSLTNSCAAHFSSCATQLFKTLHPNAQLRHASLQLRHATVQGITSSTNSRAQNCSSTEQLGDATVEVASRNCSRRNSCARNSYLRDATADAYTDNKIHIAQLKSKKFEEKNYLPQSGNRASRWSHSEPGTRCPQQKKLQRSRLGSQGITADRHPLALESRDIRDRPQCVHLRSVGGGRNFGKLRHFVESSESLQKA
ncbi:hypothetical protein JCGZ_26613 [Jatropha curcas]|uniref:Uncharacterized protein n=1 Tax=Jatropha curcas TaxID=180498 RepID=A0A067JXW0_JATCU|nr:hypothetical protein JCGZ_26613 [Jatropha curcas]